MSRILILDIETAPNVAYVWSFFKTNVGANQVVDNGYMLSYAAKWLDSDKIFYEDLTTSKKEKGLLKKLKPLLDEADIVVAHNGAKFDLPTIAGRFMMHGIEPASPFKIVDTCITARKQFRFPSNSLQYLSNVLDLAIKKGGHKKYPGFELWLGVLRDEKEAWEEMKEYNILDILTLQELYIKMLPFIKNHPNVMIFDEDVEVLDEAPAPVCGRCGSEHVQRRGFDHTNAGVFHRFQCKDCGGWGRTPYALNKNREGRQKRWVNT